MTVFMVEETSACGISVMDRCQVQKTISGEKLSKIAPVSWDKNSASESRRGDPWVCLEEEFSEKLHCSGCETDSVRIDHPYASVAVAQTIDRSDLASLIETCELDMDFLKEAVKDKENFQHFLDDVISNYDVPADDIVLGLLDEGFSHRVSAKSPYLPVPSLNTCLFSTAGSTEPRLCASVSCSVPTAACSPSTSRDRGLFQTNNTSRDRGLFQTNNTSRDPGLFQTTATSSALTFSSSTFVCSSSSSSTSATSSICAKEEKKADHSVNSRYKEDDENTAAIKADNLDDGQCDLTIAFPRLQDVGELKAGLDDNNNVFCPESKDLLCGDCLSVSLSHRISNGVCLLCSAARLMKVRDSCGCQELSYFSTPLRLSIPDAEVASSGSPSPVGGKRKSEDDGRKTDSADDMTASWKRAKLDSAGTEVLRDGSKLDLSRDSPTGHLLDRATEHESAPWEVKDDQVAGSKDEVSLDRETESSVDMLSLFHLDNMPAEDPLSLMMEQRFL